MVASQNASPIVQPAILASWSHDGKWIHFASNRSGESQVPQSVQGRSFAIVNDGIYFIPRPDSTGRYSIQSFTFATKRTKPIATVEKPVSVLSVSPDGRWILYSQIDQIGAFPLGYPHLVV